MASSLVTVCLSSDQQPATSYQLTPFTLCCIPSKYKGSTHFAHPVALLPSPRSPDRCHIILPIRTTNPQLTGTPAGALRGAALSIAPLIRSSWIFWFILEIRTLWTLSHVLAMWALLQPTWTATHAVTIHGPSTPPSPVEHHQNRSWLSVGPSSQGTMAGMMRDTFSPSAFTYMQPISPGRSHFVFSPSNLSAIAVFPNSPPSNNSLSDHHERRQGIQVHRPGHRPR